jgi:hypothetical protein
MRFETLFVTGLSVTSLEMVLKNSWPRHLIDHYVQEQRRITYFVKALQVFISIFWDTIANYITPFLVLRFKANEIIHQSIHPFHCVRRNPIFIPVLKMPLHGI